MRSAGSTALSGALALLQEKTNDKYGQSQALAEAAKCMKGVGGKGKEGIAAPHTVAYVISCTLLCTESLSYLQRVIPILAEQGKHAQVARVRRVIPAMR